MAKTKEDYRIAGRNDYHRRLRGEALECIFTTPTESWQSRSYFEGYEAEEERIKATVKAAPTIATFDSMSQATETGRLDSSKPARANTPKGHDDGIKPEYMAANTAGWPPATREHARLLAISASQERSPGRRRRLEAALRRLQLRHGRP